MFRTNGVRLSGWLRAAVLGMLLTAGAVVPAANCAETAPRQTQTAQAAQEIGEGQDTEDGGDGNAEANEDTQQQDGQTQVVELSSGSVVINFPDGITTVVLDDETVAEFNDAIMSTLASVTGTTSGSVDEDLANALGGDVGSFIPGQTVAGPEERLALELLSGQLGGLDTQAGQPFGQNQGQPFQNSAQTFSAPPNQTNPLFDGLYTDGTEEEDTGDTRNATPMDTSSQ